MFNLINININLNLNLVEFFKELFKRKETKVVIATKPFKNKRYYGRRRKSLYYITDKILEENLKMFYPNCKEVSIDVKY